MTHAEKHLLDLLHSRCSKGPISYQDYIDLVLYTDDCGYYRQQRERVSRCPEQDFYTAESLSKVFARLVVSAAADLLGPERLPPVASSRSPPSRDAAYWTSVRSTPSQQVGSAPRRAIHKWSGRAVCQRVAGCPALSPIDFPGRRGVSAAFRSRPMARCTRSCSPTCPRPWLPLPHGCRSQQRRLRAGLSTGG